MILPSQIRTLRIDEDLSDKIKNFQNIKNDQMNHIGNNFEINRGIIEDSFDISGLTEDQLSNLLDGLQKIAKSIE